MTLPEATTGIFAEALADPNAGGGGGETPPIFAPIRPFGDEVINSFTVPSTLTDAAGTVKQTLSSAASTVANAATSLFNTVTGKGNAQAVPVVNVQASTAPAGASMSWVWFLLAAVGAYVVYHFAAGKGKGKSFISKARVSGTAAKRYGK